MYTQLLVRRYLTTRIIPLIAVGAVALCVALVVIVVSVMTGFLDTLRASGRTLMGDVVISYPIQGIPDYEALIATLKKLPEVEAASPLVDGYGLVRMPYPAGPSKQVVTAQVWAIEPESFQAVTGFDQSVYWRPPADAAARAAMLPDDPRLAMDDSLHKAGVAMRTPDGALPATVLGIHLSAANVRQGDGSYRPRYPQWFMPGLEVTLSLVPISDRGTVSQSTSRVFKIVNEVMSGVFQVDKNRIFIPLKDGQEMLRLDAAPIVDTTEPPDAKGNYPVIGTSPAKATQILIRAKQGVTPDELSLKVANAYEQWYALRAADPTVKVRPPSPDRVGIETWEQRLHDLIAPVEKERQMMRILFSITYLVCAGLILAIFWSIVSEKTRDIGILRAIGASRVGVLWIFLRYGLVVGIAGSIVGLGLGWLVVHRINDIHEALGHDAPMWSWVLAAGLAVGALFMAIRSMWRFRALPTLLWTVATLAMAGVTAGLYLHKGFLMWDPAVYYFNRIPSQVDWWSALGTCIGAVVFSVLGAAVPAARAADIDPIHALRYE
ncbi:MAG: FtsX-like permease family protein [Phycisphaerales bacterium]